MEIRTEGVQFPGNEYIKGFSLQCVGTVCLNVAATAVEQLCAVDISSMRLCHLLLL